MLGLNEFSIRCELERALQDSVRNVGSEFLRKLNDYVRQYPNDASEIKFMARVMIPRVMRELESKLTVGAC